MDATPSPTPRDATSVDIHITAPAPDDAPGIAGHFTCRSPEGWTATGTLGRQPDQGLTISRIAVEAAATSTGPGAIGSTVLRKIPTGQILAEAHKALLPQPAIVGHMAAEAPRPGRAPLRDEQLREVAELYLEETAPGKPRGAINRVAERLDRPAPTISRWVGRAREAGWLGPAVPGREGGEPGPRLLDVRPVRSEVRIGESGDCS